MSTGPYSTSPASTTIPTSTRHFSSTTLSPSTTTNTVTKSRTPSYTSTSSTSSPTPTQPSSSKSTQTTISLPDEKTELVLSTSTHISSVKQSYSGTHSAVVVVPVLIIAAIGVIILVVIYRKRKTHKRHQDNSIAMRMGDIDENTLPYESLSTEPDTSAGLASYSNPLYATHSSILVNGLPLSKEDAENQDRVNANDSSLLTSHEYLPHVDDLRFTPSLSSPTADENRETSA